MPTERSFASHGVAGQVARANADRGGESRAAGGRDGIAGQDAAQGTWLSNRQYKEYLDLLKQRGQAQQVISVPLNPANYPGVTIGSGGGLAPYSISQPGYGFLAPPGTNAKAPGSKASGYGGLPSQHSVGLPKRTM